MKRFFALFIVALLNFSSALPLQADGFENTNKGSTSAMSYSLVSPNPAKDWTVLEFQNPRSETHRIEIYDIIGNSIATYNVDKNQLRIDLSEFNAGVYFYFILKGTERVSTGRLVVKN